MQDYLKRFKPHEKEIDLQDWSCYLNWGCQNFFCEPYTYLENTFHNAHGYCLLLYIYFLVIQSKLVNYWLVNSTHLSYIYIWYFNRKCAVFLCNNYSMGLCGRQTVYKECQTTHIIYSKFNICLIIATSVLYITKKCVVVCVVPMCVSISGVCQNLC